MDNSQVCHQRIMFALFPFIYYLAIVHMYRYIHFHYKTHIILIDLEMKSEEIKVQTVM